MNFVQILLLVLPALVQSVSKFKDPPLGHTKCDISWKKIGCFHDPVHPPILRPFPKMLVNDRDKNSFFNDGHLLNWKEWRDSLHSLACRCAEYTRQKGYKMFGLQFYGECWSVKNAEQIYNKFGASTECLMGYGQKCDKLSDHVCIGKAFTNYVYTLTPIIAANMQNVFRWGEWQSGTCSVTCGGGTMTQSRVCIQGDCVGNSSRTIDCNTANCRTIHRIKPRIKHCSKCTVLMDRYCVCKTKNCPKNPRKCVICRLKKCPSLWQEWETCSQTCGGGVQRRTRTIKGSEEIETRNCNVGECPESCPKALDIGIIIDMSSSVGKDNCRRIATFIRNLVPLFNVNEQGTHFSFILYAHRPYFRLVNGTVWSWDSKAILKMLKKLCKSYRGGGTRTDLALQLAAKSPRFQNGLRKDKPKVLMTITDGMTDPKHSAPLEEVVKPLAQQGITSFAIAVGSERRSYKFRKFMAKEMVKIAYGQTENVFQLWDWSQLESGLKSIVNNACRNPVTLSEASRVKRNQNHKGWKPTKPMVNELLGKFKAKLENSRKGKKKGNHRGVKHRWRSDEYFDEDAD